jgi:hypothetical protein
MHISKTKAVLMRTQALSPAVTVVAAIEKSIVLFIEQDVCQFLYSAC